MSLQSIMKSEVAKLGNRIMSEVEIYGENGHFEQLVPIPLYRATAGLGIIDYLFECNYVNEKYTLVRMELSVEKKSSSGIVYRVLRIYLNRIDDDDDDVSMDEPEPIDPKFHGFLKKEW